MGNLNEMHNASVTEIQSHREEIDKLDTEIVGLLNKRVKHSIAIRHLKPNANMQLFDPVREQEILMKLTAQNSGPLTNEGLTSIYKVILKIMKETPDM